METGKLLDICLTKQNLKGSSYSLAGIVNTIIAGAKKGGSVFLKYRAFWFNTFNATLKNKVVTSTT